MYKHTEVENNACFNFCYVFLTDQCSFKNVVLKVYQQYNLAET